MHTPCRHLATKLACVWVSVCLVAIAMLAGLVQAAELPNQAYGGANQGSIALQDAEVSAVLAQLSGKSDSDIRVLRNQLGSWQKVVATLQLDEKTVRKALSKVETQAPVKSAKVSRNTAQASTNVSIGQRPLPELGPELYKGKQGGLYPGGINTPPQAHLAAGLNMASQIQPLNGTGQPDPKNGKIVLITLGMSNTTQETRVWQRVVAEDSTVNPKLVVVDGAQGGMDTTKVLDINHTGTGKQYWENVSRRLADAGVTAEQVQIAWLKQAVVGPTLPFPADAESLQAQLRAIVQKAKSEFPNLKLMYVSNRTYAGYANTGLNPEPFAYQSGFAVKWLIEEQITGNPALNFDPTRGNVVAPWLAWGPYLWTDGLTPRADGLIWERSDTVDDGTHPSASGQAKVAQLLQRFFKEDVTTKTWFLGK